jgi:2-polyprenyl-3-methyl-5-hydroxy-6-metoxy-1,4-benzoquinol methylase
MATTNQAKELFSEGADEYGEKEFTHYTDAEVDFILAECGLPPGSAILDMGCGTGRHAVALACRGYRVTGVDIAAGMLNEARAAADAAGVAVEWIEADATRFATEERFDAALCLCGGGFGILNLGDDPAVHDRAVLRAIAAALRPGASLILTTLNAFARLRELTDDDIARGDFDPLTLAETYTDEAETPSGTERLRLKERRWLPPELIALCESAGFIVAHLWGGTSGQWNRRPLRLDEPEVMVVGCRRTN